MQSPRVSLYVQGDSSSGATPVVKVDIPSRPLDLSDVKANESWFQQFDRKCREALSLSLDTVNF